MRKRQSKSQNHTWLSLFCSGRFEISNLWNLNVIGIQGPVEVKSDLLLEGEAVSHFSETVKLIDQNRYEVCLPWIEGHPEFLVTGSW